MRNHHARRLLPASIAIIKFYLKGRLRTIFRRPFLSQVKDELGKGQIYEEAVFNRIGVDQS